MQQAGKAVEQFLIRRHVRGEFVKLVENIRPKCLGGVIRAGNADQAHILPELPGMEPAQEGRQQLAACQVTGCAENDVIEGFRAVDERHKQSSGRAGGVDRRRGGRMLFGKERAKYCCAYGRAIARLQERPCVGSLTPCPCRDKPAPSWRVCGAERHDANERAA